MSALEASPVASAPPGRRVRAWAARAAMTLAGAALLAGVGILTVLPMVTGSTALTVLSGSMAPTLPTGSLVFDRPIDASRLHVGDIATYRERLAGRYVLVTHRIVAIDRSTTPITFTFRGDANRSADPVAVPGDQIRGKVWFDIPYLGSVRSRLADLRPLLVPVGVTGLGSYAAWSIAAGLRERRSRR